MKINLNGKWYLDSARYSHLPASIPGSVLSTLLEHHLIEDPFLGIMKIKYVKYSMKITRFPENSL